MARPRKENVVRDKTGKSRGEREEIHPETLAVRSRELRNAGLTESFATHNAANALAGFTLGVLHLRWQANKDDPGGISADQYNAGQSWAQIVHRHAAIMGYKLHIHTPSFVMVGGGAGSGTEPTEEEILAVRRRWSDCYNSLMQTCRDHGHRVSVVTYGVCVENWPVAAVTPADHGRLRLGLNSIVRIIS